jgi:hypothetical protein
MQQTRLTLLLETPPNPLGLPVTHPKQPSRRRHAQLAALNFCKHHHPFPFLATHF